MSVPILLIDSTRLRDLHFGLGVTAVVVALLVIGELLRAHGGPRATRTALATTLATIPVLALFAAVMIARFAILLHR
jgi:hypothetical protein